MLDVRVKERLTGAIILVALLVLLVPELLTGPGRSAASTATQAGTTADGAQMRSYTIDLSDGPNAQRAAAPPMTDTPSVPGPTPDPQSAAAASGAGSPSVEAPLSSASETSRPSMNPATDAPRSSAAEESRAGADKFSAPSRNDSASRAAGPTSSGAAPVGSRPSDGPSAPGATEGRENASRADAGSKSGASADAPAVANIARPARANADIGTRGEPSPTPRVSPSEAPTGKGWAWQVGSFASRENAEKLTRQLKGKGFAASVSETAARGGKRLWRVRVGPEADRAAAVALGARLRSAGQPGGAVVPYP
jgi:DedD protein